MKLKLACSDFSFPLLGFEATLDLLVSLKIRGVDVCLFEGYQHLTPSEELKNPVKSGERLRAKLATRGLELADVFVIAAKTREELAPSNPDPADNRRSREIFQRSLDFTSAAGGDHLTQLPGVKFSGQKAETGFARAAEELAWRANRAAVRKTAFAVEPHIGSIADSPQSALRLLQKAPGLTYSLDYSHFVRAGYTESEIEPLLPYASHFHIRGANRKRLQCSFEQNTIDYLRAIKLMQRTKYRGYHAIEYVWIDWERCNECDNLSEIVRFRDYLQSAAKAL